MHSPPGARESQPDDSGKHAPPPTNSETTSAGPPEQLESTPHAPQHVDAQKSQGKKRTRSLRRELQFLVDDNGKRARRDLPKCPVCDMRVETEHWAAHYEYERRRLTDLDSGLYINSAKGKTRGAAMAARQQMEKSSGKKAQSIYEEILERTGKNRQSRHERLQRLDGPRAEDTMSADELAFSQALLEETEIQRCFICNRVLHGDSDAVNAHIDQCLEASSGEPESNVPDATQDEQPTRQGEWDEYEWAGQTRVRATAMMEGGYSGAGFATARKVEDDEEDEDLDVEDDDAAQYGTTQYDERDIVVNMDDENEDTSALREMVSGSLRSASSTSDGPADEEDDRRSGFEETVSDKGWEKFIAMSQEESASGSTHSRLLIDALKARIQQLESASRSTPRCLICLDVYKKPLTSIVCWHVHCERCWLQTLGSKKLCPQCQKITTPADLRRIYL